MRCRGERAKLKWRVPEITRPHTTAESSPGAEQLGAQPSSAMWQMPHTSSSVVHVQLATACQFLTSIFMPPQLVENKAGVP